MNLGIDVSKNTLDCCLISDGIFFERQFKNNSQDLSNSNHGWIKTAQRTPYIAAAKQQANITKMPPTTWQQATS